jgi:glycosyltransferase involved in cell wall biosynthesis
MQYRKLIVQIPAYNEESDIICVIRNIPHRIEEIEEIEIVVINDGSTDSTVELVEKQGIAKIINHDMHRGLGSAFRTGISYSLERHADIIVNLDADCQYDTGEIYTILRPIFEKKAGIVIGDRQLIKVKGYPLYKLISQFIANALVQIGFKIIAKDVTSGFRAFSKESAYVLQKTLKNNYTYTLESICVLARRRIPIIFVPINIRFPTRSSRLIRSKLYYVANFLMTFIRCLSQDYK